MSMKEYFNLDCKKLHSTAGSKQEVLNEVAERAVQAHQMKKIKKELIRTKLYKRETIGSTGFGNGIAIPHCTLPGLDSFVVGALICDKGIDFNSADGEKVRLFIYIIAPQHRRNEHIRILSDISKILRVKDNIDRLVAQKDTES